MISDALRPGDEEKLRELPGKLTELARQLAEARAEIAAMRPKLELALSDWHSLQGSLHTALQLFGGLCIVATIFFTVRTWKK